MSGPRQRHLNILAKRRAEARERKAPTTPTHAADAEKAALGAALRGDDGYPTDEALDAIRTFTGSAKELVEVLHEGMRTGGGVMVEEKLDDFDRPIREVYMFTGGWSGCESIIGELERSFFWFAYWYQSRRGGAFWFRVPFDRWETQMPEWPFAGRPE